MKWIRMSVRTGNTRIDLISLQKNKNSTVLAQSVHTHLELPKNLQQKHKFLGIGWQKYTFVEIPDFSILI